MYVPRMDLGAGVGVGVDVDVEVGVFEDIVQYVL